MFLLFPVQILLEVTFQLSVLHMNIRVSGFKQIERCSEASPSHKRMRDLHMYSEKERSDNDRSYEMCGPGTSVGIATDYWLDGPGSNQPAPSCATRQSQSEEQLIIK